MTMPIVADLRRMYLITYDLNQPGQNYEELIDAITDYEYSIEIMKSCWLISTPTNAKDVTDRLSMYVDDNDYIFVTQISENCGWQLDPDVEDDLENDIDWGK